MRYSLVSRKHSFRSCHIASFLMLSGLIIYARLINLAHRMNQLSLLVEEPMVKNCISYQS